MTRRKKAIELVNKIYYCQKYAVDEDYIPLEAYKRAKQCALIAVDEVIEQNNIWINQTGKGTNNYWKLVKEEINNL